MGGVLGQSLSLVTELALQFSMLITLFFFSPILTLLCLCFFSILFFILNKVQGGKARIWGLGMTQADVSSTSLIADAIGSYREIVVSGRRSFFINNIKRARQEAARFQVNKSMLTQFSKYIFEISVVIAGLGISAYAFLTKPALQAASLVAIFFTAAYRIAPSVLKLQQGVLQLKGAAGATELFFEIQDHLNRSLTSSHIIRHLNLT
jgi:ABC-type multidrug transport system fused ATPase/permease subunit